MSSLRFRQSHTPSKRWRREGLAQTMGVRVDRLGFRSPTRRRGLSKIARLRCIPERHRQRVRHERRSCSRASGVAGIRGSAIPAGRGDIRWGAPTGWCPRRSTARLCSELHPIRRLCESIMATAKHKGLSCLNIFLGQLLVYSHSAMTGQDLIGKSKTAFGILRFATHTDSVAVARSNVPHRCSAPSRSPCYSTSRRRRNL